MIQLTRAALGAAVVLSAVAIADAVFNGVGAVAPWTATPWADAAVGVAHVLTYGLLAAVLVVGAQQIDGESAVRRWIRRTLAADLVVLAIGLAAFTLVGEHEVIGAIAAVGFILMFLLGVVLGASLLRRAGMRLPAALMVAPLALIPLTFLVEAIAPAWAHPAYAEAALAVGLALLGRCATPAASIGPRYDERLVAGR